MNPRLNEIMATWRSERAGSGQFPPGLTIAVARAQEANLAADIAREAATWRAAVGHEMWDEQELALGHFQSHARLNQLYLARIDGDSVGTMVLQWEDAVFWPDLPPGESAFIHRLAVRRRVAGTGVARALIAHAGSVARRAGRRYLRLDCGPWERLCAFYESCGFLRHSRRAMAADGSYGVVRYQMDLYARSDAEIAALLESLQAAGLLRATTNAVLLGEQYHLGGAEDTRRMAHALALTADDRVLDLACYVGGPARQLAREYACQVVGVDISEDCIAIAEKLTQVCELSDRVRFICCSADSVPLPDESFTVAWSQCSFPPDLSWLPEMRRLLLPGGRVAFTGLIRRSDLSDPSLFSLDEIADRVAEAGFRVISAQDISEMDLDHGWYRSKEKLRANDAHYCTLMGEPWVRQAYAELDIDTESWRSGREGNGRIIAVKE